MKRILAAAAIAFAGSTIGVRAETVIRIATHYTQAQLKPLTACFRAYEAQHPGIRIVHEQSDIEDYLQTVMTSKLGGTSPDIYNVYSLWSAQLIDTGLLARPPASVLKLIHDDYAASTQDAVKVDGELWGIPSEVSAFMLVYNKKLLAAAGAGAPPSTWDDLVDIAGRIAKRNAQGNLTTAGYAFGPTVANGVYPFETLLLSRGVSPFKEDHSGTNLTSPEAIAVLDGQRRLYADKSASDAVQVRDFPSGSVGMMIMANWYKNTLKEAFGNKFDETVGVAPIPGGPNWKTLQYAFFWGVDGDSRVSDQAWALLAWLNTPQQAGKRSCVGEMLVQLGALTGNKADIAASQDAFGDAFTKPYVDAISSGRAVSVANLVHGAEINTVLRTAIGRAWSGASTPHDALVQADREITGLLREGR